MADLTPEDTLGEHGRAFFDAVLEEYEPSMTARRMLLETARCVDELETLAAAIKERGTIVRGSQGQPVANPAYGEARATRLLFARFVEQLDIGELESVATIRARTAANARWAG